MNTPDEVDVWIGLDVGKEDHFADVLGDEGESLFAPSVANDEADLVALFERAGELGTPGLVIDQPGSIAQLAIAVAARGGVPVAYVPGLVMRRAADLYPGEAKTDRRDAFAIARPSIEDTIIIGGPDEVAERLSGILDIGFGGFTCNLAPMGTCPRRWSCGARPVRLA